MGKREETLCAEKEKKGGRVLVYSPVWRSTKSPGKVMDAENSRNNMDFKPFGINCITKRSFPDRACPGYNKIRYTMTAVFLAAVFLYKENDAIVMEFFGSFSDVFRGKPTRYAGE